MKRHAICLCLALLLLLALPTGRARAAEVDHGTCGPLTWSLNEEGVLSFAGSGGVPNYASPDKTPWYAHRAEITALSFPDTLTGIGSHAFSGCTALTSVSIPAKVANIGAGAFAYCTALTGFTVDPANGSFTTGMDSELLNKDKTVLYAFPGANLLDFATTLQEIRPYACAGCKTWPATYAISLPNALTTIGAHAFDGCSAYEITLFDKVTSIGDRAFAGITDLRYVNINAANLSDGTASSEWFAGSGDEEIGITLTVSNTVKHLPAYMFAAGSSAEIPDVRVIYFQGEKPSVGSSFLAGGSPRCGYNGSGAGWSSLPSLGSSASPEWIDFYEVPSFGICGKNARWDLDAEGTLRISGSGPVYCYGEGPITADCYPWFDLHNGQIQTAEIREVILEDQITALPGGFYRNTNLASVTIGKGTASIGAYTFAKCNALKTVTFLGDKPSFDPDAFTEDTLTIRYDGSNKTWKTLPTFNEYTTVTWKPFGWHQNSKGWWYEKADGSYPAGVWQEVGGKWYHFDQAGYMQTGWQKINNRWYYFHSGGAMATGWLKLGSSWYYLTSSGAMGTGWQKISGKWYYFNGSGVMQTGWQKISDTWYYFFSGGSMATGWQKVGSQWYCFSGGGKMYASCWVGNYYLKANGVMAADEWIGNYYVGPDGKWVPGKTR